MAVNVDAQYIKTMVGSFETGTSTLTDVKKGLSPYQTQANPAAMEIMREQVKRLKKKGVIDEKTAKTLGGWATKFSGMAGKLESKGLIGPFFRFLWEILSKIPIIGKLLFSKNFE